MLLLSREFVPLRDVVLSRLWLSGEQHEADLQKRSAVVTKRGGCLLAEPHVAGLKNAENKKMQGRCPLFGVLLGSLLRKREVRPPSPMRVVRE